jgi:hypothetical protein
MLIIIQVVAWAVRSWRARNLLGLERAVVLRVLPGVGLAGLGLGLFAMVETEANYQVDTIISISRTHRLTFMSLQLIHSAWHMLMGLALLFLLPDGKEPTSPSPRRGRSSANPPLLDASSQELCDVNDYYATNPVFILTTTSSSQQLLVTSES